MENTVENVVSHAFDTVVAPAVATTEAPAAPKVDRRKGVRKTVNADGTVSYGTKADGTPRSKPGRRPKTTANAA